MEILEVKLKQLVTDLIIIQLSNKTLTPYHPTSFSGQLEFNFHNMSSKTIEFDEIVTSGLLANPLGVLPDEEDSDIEDDHDEENNDAVQENEFGDKSVILIEEDSNSSNGVPGVAMVVGAVDSGVNEGAFTYTNADQFEDEYLEDILEGFEKKSEQPRTSNSQCIRSTDSGEDVMDIELAKLYSNDRQATANSKNIDKQFPSMQRKISANDNSTCMLCNKTFTGTQLVKHIDSHKTEDLYKCEDCGKMLANHLKGHLLYYIATHYITTVDSNKYRCNFCHTRTSCKDEMIKHLRKHTGAGPFQCNPCKVGYRKSRIKQDNQTHISAHVAPTKVRLKEDKDDAFQITKDMYRVS